MTDRLLSELTRGDTRRTFGVVCALVALAGITVNAAAQTPAPSTSEAPAPAPAGASPAPAPALPTPTEQPATDGADVKPASPRPPPLPDSDESPAVPPPAVSPETLAATTPSPSRSAPEPPDLNQIDDGQMGSHQEHWLLGVGIRETLVTGKGYDPFSTDNVLPQVSLDLGRAFYTSGPLSIAGMAVWDYGSTKATARGADTWLGVHRITAAAEGRYHLLRRFYVFGRVGAGALHSAATFHDQVVGIDRESDAWVFTSDYSLGAAFEFAGDARGASTRPRGWVGADAGYSWSAASKLAFNEFGSDGTAPTRLETLRFDDLALRGGFFRLTATVTY